MKMMMVGDDKGRDFSHHLHPNTATWLLRNFSSSFSLHFTPQNIYIFLWAGFSTFGTCTKRGNYILTFSPFGVNHLRKTWHLWV